MHVLVIGAGVSGLCSAKHLLDAGFETTIYEKSNEIGGGWIYTDDIDSPDTGVTVHSSMYQNLRANLPKEISYFPDLPFPEQDTSFVTQLEMLKYIRWYADQFNIKDNISFEHDVIRVTPYDESKWEVIVHDKKQDEYLTKIFDAVMVCNGHHSTPYFSLVPGSNIFKGNKLHSHNYRRGDVFKDQSVLIIGGGPSGRDIAPSIAEYATKVTVSHHLPSLASKTMPLNLFQKPDVKQFTENGAEFEDGTFENFDAVCYCSGFSTKFPFLSTDSEITCHQNYVRPLYKHTININRPTMAFIGLPVYIIPLPTYDLQVRFTIKHWKGETKLPSKEAMLDDTYKEEIRRKTLGLKMQHAHKLAYRKEEFFNELATISETKPLKPVLSMIHNVVRRRNIEDFIRYKDDRYCVIDDYNFIRTTDGVEYRNS